MKETVLIGGRPHEIDLREVNLIYKSSDLHERIRYPGRVELDPEAVEYHIARVASFHPRTAGMVAKVFDLTESKQITPEWCRQAGSGVRHCAGLIDISLKLCYRGLPFAWIHPESFLHPKAQANLADIVIELSSNAPVSLTNVVVDSMLEDGQ